MRIKSGNCATDPPEHRAAWKSWNAKNKRDCQTEQKRRGDQVILLATRLFLWWRFVIDAREGAGLNRKRRRIFGQQSRPGKRERRARSDKQSNQRSKRKTVIHRKV